MRFEPLSNGDAIASVFDKEELPIRVGFVLINEMML
jgi:hypothetical protein